MTCFHPLPAWQSIKCNPKTGKSIVVFSPPSRISDYRSIHVPCGQCIGCRLDYSRNWALRCSHELELYDKNCFITLTYDDDHVPWSSKTGEQTLVKKDLQDFWKRLRDHLGEQKIRYFACGEYGDETYRPHYHAIVFGYRPNDLELLANTGNGYFLYKSDLLTEKWKNGHVIVADANYDTCAYVARYVVKKLSGEAGLEKYEGIEKEFVCMSRRPGIGRSWFDKYYKDMYPYDEAIVHSYGKFRKVRPCKYYDNLYDAIDPDSLLRIKEKRMKGAEAKLEENCKIGRMDQREEFKKEQIKMMKRRV